MSWGSTRESGHVDAVDAGTRWDPSGVVAQGDSTGLRRCGNSEARIWNKWTMAGPTKSGTSSQSAERFPLEFGRYTLLESLAVGGMGEVFLGRVEGAAGFEKTVVIKQILPHLAQDPEFVRRFIAEGRLLVQLNHPAIASVSDLGVHEGQYYLVIEHVDGCDVRRLIRDARAKGRPIEARLAALILASVAEGLAHAHGAGEAEEGIVHRDISPANIMISRDGHVKLIDFGIARVGAAATGSISGAVRGKFPYMSPEQASGDPLDGRGDVFSLGVVAHELFSGKRPFDAASDLKILDRIRFDEPDSLQSLVADIDPELSDLVLQCLAKDREERPTSSEVHGRLALWLHALPNPVGASELGGLVLESLVSEDSETMSLDQALQGGLPSDSGVSQGTATWSVSSLQAQGSDPVTSDFTPAGIDEETGELLRSLLEVRPVRAMRNLKLAIAALSIVVFTLMGWNLWMMEDQKEYRSRMEAPIAAPEAPSTPDAGLARGSGWALRRSAEGSAERPRRMVETRQSHRTITVTSRPAGARVRIGSGAPERTPLRLTLEPGDRLEGTATLRGHRARSFTLTPDSPDEVRLRLAPMGKGAVRFRFFPASASVFVDGRKIDTGGRNVVSRLELDEGSHVLEVRTKAGAQVAVRKFSVRAGELVQLKTIER